MTSLAHCFRLGSLETGLEAEICTQEAHGRVPWGSTRVRRTGLGIQGKLVHDVVPSEAQAGPRGNSGAGNGPSESA